ncbi:hypothetical protein ACFLX1_02035, partial [Chloroflexota bacterium]
KQVLDAFQDVISPEVPKFICAPCSNCKGQFRDLIGYYDLEELYNVHYTGLVELIVNAMADLPVPYLEEAPVVEEMAEIYREASIEL